MILDKMWSNGVLIKLGVFDVKYLKRNSKYLDVNSYMCKFVDLGLKDFAWRSVLFNLVIDCHLKVIGYIDVGVVADMFGEPST